MANLSAEVISISIGRSLCEESDVKVIRFSGRSGAAHPVAILGLTLKRSYFLFVILFCFITIFRLL